MPATGEICVYVSEIVPAAGVRLGGIRPADVGPTTGQSGVICQWLKEP